MRQFRIFAHIIARAAYFGHVAAEMRRTEFAHRGAVPNICEAFPRAADLADVGITDNATWDDPQIGRNIRALEWPRTHFAGIVRRVFLRHAPKADLNAELSAFGHELVGFAAGERGLDRHAVIDLAPALGAEIDQIE